MGVSTDLWRHRIGSYCRAAASPDGAVLHAKPLRTETTKNRKSFVPFLLLLALLIIGNVESNPGPIFKCPSCGLDLVTFESYASHLSFHSCDKNFLFSCPSVMCSQKYKSKPGLLYHFQSVHSNQSQVQVESQGTSGGSWKNTACVECNSLFNSCYNFCKHIQDHVLEGKSVMCPLRHLCEKNLLFGGQGKDPEKEKNKLAVHYSLYHRGWQTGLQIKPPTPYVFASFPASSDVCQEDEIPEPMAESESEPEEFSTDLDDKTCSSEIQRLVGTFYLMLEAHYLLPEIQIQGISEQFTIMSEIFQNHMKQVLKKALSKLNITSDEVFSVLDEFCLSDVFFNLHHKDCPGPSFTSEHLRKKCFRDMFSYVEPRQEPLDLDPHGEHVVYVSIKDTLTLLLKDPTIHEQVKQSFEREEKNTVGIYQDYHDGSVIKNRPQNKLHKKRIDLFIFQDGFSVANVLGSAKNKYKLLGSYFTIANLKPYLRSKLSSIHLISLFFEDLFKNVKFGFQCFRPLFEELKKLRTEGIEFDGEKIPVFVQHVIGDSLGAHMIGCYTMSFNGEYFCRFCEITREEFKEDPTLLKPLRKKEDYDQALEELQELKKAGHDILTHRGVKENSPFNEEISPNDFHVCDPSLPPCLGHDLFEGVVAWDLFLIIEKLVKAKWFTFEQLNQRIANFCYAQSDLANKPPPVSPHKQSKKLDGHAVQNWCLLRLLPLILEGLIKDTELNYWKLYLKLKEAVDFACAPAFSELDLQQFDNLLKQYLRDRKILEVKPKPKHHYFAHYPSLIPLLGPIIYLWTLRFESKHSFFKNVARICRNYINLCLTMGRKHQLLLAYLATGRLFSEGITESKVLASGDYTHIQDEIQNEGVPDNAVHYESLFIDDVKYQKGAYMLLERTNDDNDVNIGRILSIIVCGKCTKFVLKVFSAKYLKDRGIHKVVTTKSALIVVDKDTMRYPIPHAVYDYEDDLCFSLKYRLQDLGPLVM